MDDEAVLKPVIESAEGSAQKLDANFSSRSLYDGSKNICIFTDNIREAFDI